MADEEIKVRIRRTRRFSIRPGSKPARGSASPSKKSYGPSSSIQPTANAHGDWDAAAAELENPADPLSDSDIDPMGDITPEFAKQGENENEGELPEQEDGSDENSEEGTAKPKKNDDTDNAVENAEAAVTATGGSQTAASDEEQALQEEEKKDFENNVTGEAKQKGLVSRLKSRKAAMTVSIGAGVVTVFVSILTFLPGFILHHIGDVLNGKINALQNHQRVTYRKSKISRIQDLFSKEGRRGGKIIAEMESRGYKFHYDESGKTIKGISKPGQFDKVLFGSNVGDEISGFMEKRHPFRLSGWKQNRVIALQTRFGVRFSSPIVPKPDDPPDPDDAVRRNVARGTFENSIAEPGIIDNTAKAPEGSDAATQEDLEARADVANELATPDADGPIAEARSDLLQSGKKPEKALLDGLDDVGSLTSGASVQVANDAAKGSIRSIFKSGWSKIRGFFDVTDIPDKICTVQNRFLTIENGARRNSKLALFKQTTQIKAAVDSLRNGTLSPKMLKSLMSRFMSRDGAGRTLAESSGWQRGTKGFFSKSSNDLYKNNAATDGKLRGGWGRIKNIFTRIPGFNPSTCSKIQNIFTQIGVNLGFAAVTIFSGGTAAAAEQGSVQGIKLAIQSGIKSVLRNVVKSVIASAALDIGFEGLMALMQFYVEKTLAFPVTTTSQGAQAADEATSGGGAITEVTERYRGAVPATIEQFNMAQKQYLAEKKEEMKHQSVFARYFDTQNLDSFAWNTSNTLAFGAAGFQSDPQSIVGSIARAPASLFGSLAGTFMPKTSAAEEADDYTTLETYTTEGERSGLKLATDPYGNLLTIIPKNKYDDSAEAEKENIDFLKREHHVDPITGEPSSSLFKGYMTNCGTSIEVISVIEAGSGKVEEDCLAEQDLTLRFIAYLGTMDTEDAIEAEFFPEELDAQATNTGGNGTTGVRIGDLTGPIIPCEGSTKELVRTGDRVSWDGTTPTGSIGKNSAGQDINVYIRDACSGISAVRTVVIGSSIHGSENGGQYVAQDLLYNRDLPDDVRIIAIPEINKSGIPTGRRKNENNVNLNRNFDYKWSAASCSATSDGAGCKGPSPASEPETQAIQTFLSSVGESSLAISYHDNKNLVYYSAPNDNLSLPIGNKYYQIANSLGVGFDSVGRNDGEGFLESWYTDKTGTPALLIEMSSDSTSDYLKKHTDTVVKILEEQGLVR